MHSATLIALAMLLLAVRPVAACQRTQPEPFAEFLSQFTHSMDFAIARTTFPLRATKLDMQATPEPTAKPVRITRTAFKERGTISTQLRQDGLKLRQSELGGKDMQVQVYKPDTGWLVVYHFRLHQNCWQLTRLSDEST